MNWPPNRSSRYTSPLHLHSGGRITGLQAKTAAPGLPVHERQRRREAAQREGRMRVSLFELLGGRAVGGDEEGEAFVEDLTHGLARRVEERGWRPLHPLGTGPGVLGQDLRHSERGGLPSASGPRRLPPRSPGPWPRRALGTPLETEASSRVGARRSRSRSSCTGEGRGPLPRPLVCS
jgi:hypothetical protein